MTSQLFLLLLSTNSTAFFSIDNLSKESTETFLGNVNTIISIAIATIIALAVAIIKGSIKYFSPEKQLPRSLYFTQSYESRLKEKEYRSRQNLLILIVISISFAFMLYSIGHATDQDIVITIVSAIFTIASIVLLVGMIRWAHASFSSKNILGKSARIRKWGRISFLAFVVTIFGIVYVFSFAAIKDAYSFWKLTHLDPSTLDSSNPLHDPNALANAIAAYDPAIIFKTILWLIIAVSLYLFASMLLYSSMLKTDDKEEYISLGYVLVNGNPLFIHYLEGDNYICSESAYYSEYGSVEIKSKDWIAQQDKTYLIDPILREQITDLNNYKDKLRDLPALSEINKRLEEESIIKKGQYQHLSEDEVGKLNTYMKEHQTKDKDAKDSEKRQKKAQKLQKKNVKKHARLQAKSRKVRARRKKKEARQKAWEEKKAKWRQNRDNKRQAKEQERQKRLAAKTKQFPSKEGNNSSTSPDTPASGQHK
jgi:hypothetical protein